ncbi:hypothetical protein C8Q74DRAFT_394068 [Fomes fomentarius]|nr:hypothetical protein C8Q74DRAFT_394068 [Fomes fomentarius]
MSSKYHLFAILLVNVLAAVINTSARSTAEEGLVKHTDLRDDHGRDVYLWRISENEQERLSALLEQDFYDLEVDGTYLNSPPQTCSHCGKETEFADWVYTALKRGIHSPEFIAESLKLGNIPKGRLHDVYCSRCGHLTAFRNPTGEEGGAYHVSHATPYDRTTRTFGRFNWKREVDDETTEEATTAAIQPEANPGVDHTDGWPAGFNWIYKREESAVEDTEPAHTDGWPAGFNWVYKREVSTGSTSARSLLSRIPSPLTRMDGLQVSTGSTSVRSLPSRTPSPPTRTDGLQVDRSTGSTSVRSPL